MKILLDECVTKHLKPHLIGHQFLTVRELGWSGVKNGKLLTLCVENEFDILLTIDKNLQYQQHLGNYPLTIVIFNSISSKVEELIEFVLAFELQLPGYQKHTAYLLNR